MVRSFSSRAHSRLVLALLAACAVLAGPLAPHARGALVADEIRIGEHAGFVRVVIDFSGGRVLPGEAVASDPDPFPDGIARIPLERRGVRTRAAAIQAHGVGVRIGQGSRRIVIHLTAAPRRFKYVRYFALRNPHRLVLDLYESAPPTTGAEQRRGPRGCLSLTSHSIRSRIVRAAGRERDLFEHSLAVRLRGADGRVIRERGVTAADGRWATRFRHPALPRQAATLEGVALSAKDGTLECIVQVRVTLTG